MRHLLLTTLFLSSIALAQEGITGADEASLNRDESGNVKRGGFSCPDGTGAACLDIGDKVCPGSTKCVDVSATCFDEYPCDLSEGFVCESGYDDVLDDLKQAVRQHDELALENVVLRERRLEQKNCVLGASTLDNAKRCVRQP